MCAMSAPSESFAFHDVSFHPNHFLRCTKFHRHAQQLVAACAVEPRSIYFAQTIAGAKNQIKDISLVRRLGQPVRECQFGFVPCARQRTERSLHMIWPNIEIEVLGATRHTPAHFHHVCSADQERNFGSMQRCHRSAMKLTTAPFTLSGWNCPCCACSHHSSITHWNRYTRACRERTLTRNVHP